MSTTTATLSFYVPPADGSRAFLNVNGQDKNWGEEPKLVTIQNLRGKEDEASLDKTGFQFYKHPAKHTSFDNDEKILGEYYPESIELIKELTGASRVVLFDHTIRRRRPEEKEDTPDKRQPVSKAHIDQTPKAALARVHRHLPAADVSALLEKRYQIINLWRPIHHAAFDWPLALCDFRSVDADNDIVPVDLVYPDRVGEISGVRYNEGHKWTYLKGMEPDELVLIKCFDSLRDGSVALFTPHTGFDDPSTPEGSPLRESIELRALVFYD